MDSSLLRPFDNPMQTDGFEFVEYTSPYTGDLEALFSRMGFIPIAKHPHKSITLYRQGRINFIINRTPNSYAAFHAERHGPSACSMAFRVKDAFYAYTRALSLGGQCGGQQDTPLYSLKGIGDSLLFLIDSYENDDFYRSYLSFFPDVDLSPKGVGLISIDHLTHNVYQGRMSVWTDFYGKIFNFQKQKSFHIRGQKTGLWSDVMISPCSQISIPINESVDDHSQIAEYLKEYKGEGIQHIAFATDDICSSVERLRGGGVPFVSIPSTYYDIIRERFPSFPQDLPRLSKNHILIDGEAGGGSLTLLLQIFTQTVIGPLFFEVIQRFGHQGFGEGNFTALFEAMERDQEARGLLSPLLKEHPS